MELAKAAAFYSLMAWVLATVIRAYVCFNFEKHFGGVRFQGRYLIPSRKNAFSDITHTGIRRTMIGLKIVTFLSGLTFLVSAMAIQLLR